MSPLLRPLLALTLLIAPLPLRAQVTPFDTAATFFDLFNPQRISRISIQWIIAALRTEMDITYQGLTVTPNGREAYLTGLAFVPALPWDARRECRITVDRLDISESGGPDDVRLHFEFIGATAAPQCLEPSAANTFAVAGYEGLTMERLFLDLDYMFGSSALTATLHAAVRDVAVIEAAADLDYVWFRRAYSYDMMSAGPDFAPVIALSGLELRVEDAGMLAALRPMQSSLGIEIESIPAVVEGGLRDLMTPPDGQNISASAAALIGNVRLATERFLAEGGAITIAARPARALWLGSDSLDNPDALIEALALDVSAGPLKARGALDPTLIAAAISGDAAAMTPDERRAIGAHLMLTLGGPQATSAGRALLTTLAEGGDAEAARILAMALAKTDPEAAYGYGLLAASRQPGALALLDEAEAALPLSSILAAQTAAEAPDADAEDARTIADADIAALRRAALTYLVGGGPARNYRRAYAMASLAAAAGDRASIDLRARLTRRLSAGGGADAELWDQTAATLADEALARWVSGGLAAKLAP